MRDKLHRVFDNLTLKRHVYFQAVDLNTGNVIIFDETIPPEDLAKVIIASASIPIAFEPVQLNGYTLVDGGLYTNLQFGDAITKCRDLGFEDSKIIVDII